MFFLLFKHEFVDPLRYTQGLLGVRDHCLCDYMIIYNFIKITLLLDGQLIYTGTFTSIYNISTKFNFFFFLVLILYRFSINYQKYRKKYYHAFNE